jgi:membrane-associated phospholipid phosphatase
MDVLLWLQAVMVGPGWEAFWRAISSLYQEDWLLGLAAVLFWVADRSFARLFTTLAVCQAWLNVFLKGLFGVPRPAAGGALRVADVPLDTAYSQPSAHAQGSAALSAALAWYLRRPWFTALAVAVMLLVGVSRLYLGVHWPLDVLLGWLIGLGIALLLIGIWPYAARAAGRLPFEARLLLALAAPAAMLLASEMVPFVARLEVRYLPGALGALAGVWFGTLLEERYLPFDRRGPLAWQVAKCAVGLVLVLAVRLALKPVLGDDGWPAFARYAVVGVTVSGVAPALFAWLAGALLARPRAAGPARPG